ncbi:MAG: gliding motility protein GldN [Flavobacteriales bacterium]|jgi:gliding motility associated protien GldN|nr:gliding motility protein GldN [Flavobacteriales bacterium]
MKKLILLLVTTTLCLVVVNAQDVLTTEEMNSVYKKEKHHNKRVQQYAPLRQADVMWSRKIWREIDLRQKINHPFYYPENDGVAHTIEDRKSLIDVIYSAILEGSITAYGNAAMDDEFREEMSQEDIKKIGGAKEELIEVIDWDAVAEGADPEDAKTTRVNKTAFDRNSVKKWRLKEEWFFDKQRSVMDVRIIGMAPLQEDRDEVNGQLLGTFSPLFWVHFPEAREILINAEVFNLVKNNAERRTYDDIFWKRMFGSTIVKESSVMDRKINEYMVGLDALLEAERIKTEIFNIEHDLWEY